MKRIIITPLCFIALVFCFVTVSAKPKEKTIRTKITNNATLVYSGLAEGKIPMGEGQIQVVTDGYIRDEIKGDFNENKISNATFTFAEGYVFNGNLMYETTDSKIIYTLTSGQFEVKAGDYDRYKETFTINEGLTISRLWSDLSIEADNPLLSEQRSEIRRGRLLDDVFSDIVGTEPTISKIWTVTLNLSNGRVGNFNGNKLDYYLLDYGDKGKGYYSDTESRLRIKCSNGDTLSVTITRPVFFYALHHAEGGTLELQTKDGVNFEDPINDPLRARFVKNMPNNIKSMLDSLDIGSGNRRYLFREWELTDDNKPIGHSDAAFVVKYDNGDQYIGSIYEPEGAYGNIKSFLKMNTVPIADDYFTGVLTKSNGEEEYYIEGFTAEKYRILLDARVEDILAEKERKEQEEKEYWAKQEAREKEFKEYRENLTKKYGKKYVDAMFDQHTIIVDTPEALLKEYYICDVHLDMENQVVYRVTRSYGTQFVVTVDKKTHKVTGVRDMR